MIVGLSVKYILLSLRCMTAPEAHRADAQVIDLHQKSNSVSSESGWRDYWQLQL